jgi:hypothetical protein
MKKNILDSDTDIGLIFSILGSGIILTHLFHIEDLMNVLVVIYCVAATFLFGTLIPIINMFFNEPVIKSMIMPLIFSKMSRQNVIKMVNGKRFFWGVMIYNILCGTYFFLRMDNDALIIAVIGITFYYRLFDLMLREAIVRHLIYGETN